MESWFENGRQSGRVLNKTIVGLQKAINNISRRYLVKRSYTNMLPSKFQHILLRSGRNFYQITSDDNITSGTVPLLNVF